MNKPWMAVKEVADRFEVSASTVVRWIDQGLLRAQNWSAGTKARRIRIVAESVESFAKGREIGPTLNTCPPRQLMSSKPS